MLKVLHIASFKGNIGDRYNHKGFYTLFSNLFEHADISRIEIRDFYFNSVKQRKFDGEFASYANSFDLVVLGGGGFFDVRWENSNTGITFDISDSFIDGVSVPIWINAVGYHEFPGETTEKCVNKFECFINKILTKDNWFISIRNDGSYNRIKKRYGVDFANNFFVVPDNAFSNRDMCKKGNNCEKYLGICITNDLFSKEFNVDVDIERFNSEMLDFVIDTANKGKKIVFFQHTPQDVELVGKLFLNIPGEIKRNMILVAPYDSVSDESLNTYMEWYAKCDSIIAMRFHSCIMGLVLGIPVIALAGHAQIRDFFDEIDLSQYCVCVKGDSFSRELCNKYSTILSLEYKDRVLETEEKINNSSECYLFAIERFLDLER